MARIEHMMPETLSEQFSLVLIAVAELILVISGVIYLTMVCFLFPVLVWWACPLVFILSAILAALFLEYLTIV